MTLEMEEDRPFRFLDLPRELRDIVYDNLRESKEYPTYSDGDSSFRNEQNEDRFDNASTTTLSQIAPQVRLINRQIKTEAELQVGKYVGLTVCDASLTHWPRALTLSSSQRCLDTITNFEYSFLVLFDFDYLPSPETIYEAIHSQIVTQKGWMERSVQSMTNLKGFKLEIRIEWPVGLDKEWTQILQRLGIREERDSITNMPGLTEMKIWKLERDIRQLGICDKKLSWQWNKPEGWHTPPAQSQPAAEVGVDDGDEYHTRTRR